MIRLFGGEDTAATAPFQSFTHPKPLQIKTKIKFPICLKITHRPRHEAYPQTEARVWCTPQQRSR